MRPIRTAATVVATIVLFAGMTACTAASSAPITLSIGTNDNDDTSVADAIGHFAGLVDTASGGAITIVPEWNAGGGDVPRWDQAVAEKVIEGELDMAMVPSRAWDALGVSSLRALSAPFVVTSDQALVGATAGEVQDPMLAGLQEVGVVGLDLLPESLRHPSGLSSPSLTASDFRGAVIRAPYSETAAATYEELGATIDDGPIDPAVQDIQETSYARAAGPTVTTNITFFGKLDVLTVNGDVWEQLNDEQRRILTQASAQTQAHVIDSLPSDREFAAEFCARGGRLVAADPSEVRALEEAAQPVIDELEADPVTAAAIDALRGLAPASIDIPRACEDAATAKPVDISGTWETTITQADLEAGGVTDPLQLKEEAAVFRWEFSENAWSYDAVADHELAQPSRSGTLQIEGTRVTIFWSGQPQDNTSMDAEILPDGALRFSNIVDSDSVFQKSSEVKFGLRAWTPVDD